MSKKEFLSHLSRHLQNVPANEREDILQDYEEYFTLGEAEGKTESQIAESLGSPKLLARELLTAYHVDKMDVTSSAINIFRAVWFLIGLGFVNLIIVLSPFLGLFALLAAGWMIGVVGIASPLNIWKIQWR
ncbi:HAAS signaling domain-containing protein [Candidatus Contubernalis alkaliaceticus]|uniref:HAAS signaling domain-containing protein n=1 Tax=Candidatus Contubernalis alkaliaceticus TaxID=338645 RepID=UPI001F4BE720|nr:DUF1700 domain-containing protein [Candidatus Contubernalis alkalaceticus]UNC92054.1 DUF1700 domain-containing protein [Candidatus Contubernalis alkalaceticus]